MDNDPTKNIMKPLRQLIWLLNAALILYIFSGTERHLLKDFFCSRVLRLSDLPRCWEKPQTAICCYPSFLVCLFLFSSLNARLYMLALSAISLLIVPVWSNGLCRMDLVNQFIIWSKENSMICNPSKCKEIIFRKKGFIQDIAQVNNIPQCTKPPILGVKGEL